MIEKNREEILNDLENNICLLEARAVRAEAALKTLLGMYRKSSYFVACITPKTKSEMTKKQRKECPCWAAWDEAERIVKLSNKSCHKI